MQKYVQAVEKYRQLILDAQDYIWKNAETGWREYKTSAYMEKAFENLGYEITKASGTTGFYTVVDTGREGPEILVFGELDSLICYDHPDAVKETGAVHCCGHSAQCAALLGLAGALREPEILDGLCGRIRLCAVPAEELIEIEYRKELVKNGTIKYMGGKTEFLSRGFFDNVDIVFMVHTTSGATIIQHSQDVGCIAKHVTYKGLSAHAGSSPWKGINALYAANAGLNAANAVRETFKEEDFIRFHPIITKGGNAVNAVPDTVIIESFVRGLTFDAIKNANDKLNRALIGGALALGANVTIDDIPGYAPLINDRNLADAAEDALKRILPDMPYRIDTKTGTGSTDMGDMSSIFPSLHMYVSGAVGASHSASYFINDPERACVDNAKWQLSLLVTLLENGGKRAWEIKEKFTPLFPSPKAYLEYIDTFNRNGDRIEYHDGEAIIKL